MRRILSLTLLGLALAAVPAAAAKPPSFAAWTVRWKAQNDAQVNPAVATCAARYSSDDARYGACVVKAISHVYATLLPGWNGEVARISRPQVPVCKAAIHRYWLATRTLQLREVAYLKAHAKVTITQLNADLDGPPFSTLQVRSDTAKGSATRICG